MSSESTSQAFVRVPLLARDRDAAERALAEAFEAGASGAEEGGAGDGTTWWLYAPAAAGEAVRRAAGSGSAEAGPAEPLEARDWSEAWKQGLGPLAVTPRLLLRPSWVAAPGPAGRAELVIDPGQAFGTGSHASTRLVLEWLDRLAGRLPPGWRALDVGCGTGVLALAALRLGAAAAVALDLDRLASGATRENARANGVGDELGVFTGTLGAVAEGSFDCVLANLLSSELAPLIPALAERVTPGGWLVVSGLLAEERRAVLCALADCGLRLAGARLRGEGRDRWIALLMRR